MEAEVAAKAAAARSRIRTEFIIVTEQRRRQQQQQLVTNFGRRSRLLKSARLATNYLLTSFETDLTNPSTRAPSTSHYKHNRIISPAPVSVPWSKHTLEHQLSDETKFFIFKICLQVSICFHGSPGFFFILIFSLKLQTFLFNLIYLDVFTHKISVTLGNSITLGPRT